jgi:general stress protein YciG
MTGNKQKFDNLYDGFIQILRDKQAKVRSARPGTLLHKHHVQPKHDGGSENGEVVLCTIRHHALAHYIRYKVFGQTYDLCAYYGFVRKNEEKQKLIQQQIINTNRQRQNVMFNNKWQTIMSKRPKKNFYFQQNRQFASIVGKKGGQASGQVMTPAKMAAQRQNGTRVGTLYGRQGGLKHQNLLTKQRLSRYLEWQHDSNVFVISPPFESVRELQEYLNCFVADSVKFTSGLSEILRNKEPKRYGWRITKDLDI